MFEVRNISKDGLKIKIIRKSNNCIGGINYCANSLSDSCSTIYNIRFGSSSSSSSNSSSSSSSSSCSHCGSGVNQSDLGNLQPDQCRTNAAKTSVIATLEVHR